MYVCMYKQMLSPSEPASCRSRDWVVAEKQLVRREEVAPGSERPPPPTGQCLAAASACRASDQRPRPPWETEIEAAGTLRYQGENRRRRRRRSSRRLPHTVVSWTLSQYQGCRPPHSVRLPHTYRILLSTQFQSHPHLVVVGCNLQCYVFWNLGNPPAKTNHCHLN